MRSFFAILLAFALSCAAVSAAALVTVPTVQPSLPAAGLEMNKGQAKAGILFLCPCGTTMAVSSQSVSYSPLNAALTLVASNPNPAVSFSDPLPGQANSYGGANRQNWVTGIPRYGAATLAAIYPKINAQYTVSANGVLTLNLLLQPGANPSAIVFQIPQAVSMAVNADGSLSMSFGTQLPGQPPFYPIMTYAPPIAFQTAGSGQVSRGVSYAVEAANQFGFTVQGLDSTEPLQMSMQLNSVGGEYGPAVTGPGTQQTRDAAGNTYFAVQIPDAAGKDAPFPSIGNVGCGTVAAFSLLPYSCSDVAVYKYSASGVLDFVTYLAGRTNEIAGFVGLAPDGAVVVAGTTDSSDFPVTGTAWQRVYAGPAAGPSDGVNITGSFFAAVLDSQTGTLESATFLGGPDGAAMSTAGIGPDSSLYFLPAIAAGMPVTSGALQADCPGNPCLNGYAARLSPALDKLIYGTYLPGIAGGSQLSSDGSIYYFAKAEAGFPTTPGAYQPQNAGGYDGVVARLDPTGSHLLSATYIGTPLTDWILSAVVAPDGSVWADVYSFVECCVTGDYALVHLDANLAHLLAKLPLNVGSMASDSAGNLFAMTEGVTVSPDAFLADSCGSGELVELGPTGQQLFATYVPAGIVGFEGANSQGVPYLETSSGGRLELVENQSMGVYAGCVVDAASFGNAQKVSPGAIVTIFGSELGPTQGVGFQLENGQVPLSLGGTEVLVNGAPAPIMYSSYGQLNLIIPYSLEPGTTPTIQVVSAGGSGNQMTASVVAQGISFFTWGNGAAAALNQDGTLNSPQDPAQPGSTVMLFATGGGQTVPPSVAGEITPLELRPLAETPNVQIPGYPPVWWTAEWAGAAPGLVSGATQVNITLPNPLPVRTGWPAGTLPLTTVGNETFVSNTVTIFVPAN